MHSPGKVIFVSRNRGMLVIQHEDGFAVVELLGSEGEVAVDDLVAGDWDALGGDPLIFSGNKLDAYFQGNWASHDVAINVASNSGGN